MGDIESRLYVLKFHPIRRCLVWRSRYFEFQGPRLLGFKNEWDQEPNITIRLDFTHVRVVRTSSTENLKRLPGPKILHEFHIWHPKRRTIILSAPTGDSLCRWVEHMQQQCTCVAAKPLRNAAGFLIYRDVRYFAVLYKHEIHLYEKSTHKQPKLKVEMKRTTITSLSPNHPNTIILSN